MVLRLPNSPLFPYPTLFRSRRSSRSGKSGGAILQATRRRPADARSCLLEGAASWASDARLASGSPACPRSEEHTSELQSRFELVCRLLLEKKKKKKTNNN